VHIEHIGLQRAACVTLTMSIDNADNRAKAGNAGAVEAVVAAMRTCIEDTELKTIGRAEADVCKVVLQLPSFVATGNEQCQHAAIDDRRQSLRVLALHILACIEGSAGCAKDLRRQRCNFLGVKCSKCKLESTHPIPYCEQKHGQLYQHSG